MNESVVDNDEIMSSQIDYSKLHSLLNSATESVKKSKCKQSTLVIGNTGAGKSTLINYLLGYKLVPVEDDLTGEISIEVDSTETGYAKIGQSLLHSETLYSKTYEGSDGNTYCDCPGFNETRGDIFKIATGISIKATLNAFDSVKGIIVVIDAASFLTNRAVGIRSVIQALDNFLGISNGDQSCERLKNIFNSLIFVITKSKQKGGSLKYFNKFYQESLNDMRSRSKSMANLCKYIIENPKKLIEINCIDGGKTKNILMDQLSTVEPISSLSLGAPFDAETQSILKTLLDRDLKNITQTLVNIDRTNADIIRHENHCSNKKSEINEYKSRIEIVTNSPYQDTPHTAQLRYNIDCLVKKYNEIYDERSEIEKKIDRSEGSIRGLEYRIRAEYRRLDKHRSNKAVADALVGGIFDVEVDLMSEKAVRILNSIERRKGDIAHQRGLIQHYARQISQLTNTMISLKAKHQRAEVSLKRVWEQVVRSQSEDRSKTIKLINAEVTKTELDLSEKKDTLKKLKSKFVRLVADFKELIPKARVDLQIASVAPELLDDNTKRQLAALRPSSNGIENVIRILSDWGKNRSLSNAILCLGLCHHFGVCAQLNYSKALEFYKKSSSDRFAARDANHQIGCLYYDGLGANQDIVQALKHFEKSMQAGNESSKLMIADILDIKNMENKNPSELYVLGVCYYEGVCLEKNINTGWNLLSQSATNGFAQANCYLGVCCIYGISTNEDFYKGLRLLIKSRKQGYALAEKELKHIFEDLKDLSQSKNSEAQFILGVCYLKGLYVPRDFEFGFDLVNKAAKDDYLLAQKLMAKAYTDGHKIQRDLSKAAKWNDRLKWKPRPLINDSTGCVALKQIINGLKERSDRGDIDAVWQLAKCYLGGYGVDKDYSVAFELLNSAFLSSNPNIHYYLGVMYESGMHQDTDYYKAILSYQLSAQLNHKKSAIKLDKLVRTIAQDAENGEAGAQNLLGVCYEQGLADFNQCPNTAAHWYRLSAKNKYPEGQYNFSRCLTSGIGTERHEKKAKKYLDRAAMGGHPQAQFFKAQSLESQKRITRRQSIQITELYKSSAEQGYEQANEKYEQFKEVNRDQNKKCLMM